MTEIHNDKITEKRSEEKQLNWEARQNWLGFWNLLLQEDQRQNPHLYKKPKEDENNRDTNNTD